SAWLGSGIPAGSAVATLHTPTQIRIIVLQCWVKAPPKRDHVQMLGASMYRSRRNCAVGLLTGLLAVNRFAVPVLAWGRLGHRVVSRLTERHLTEKAKAGIASLLSEGVPHGCFGPYLQAVLAVFAGAYRLSKQQIQQVSADLFGLL